MKNIKYYPFERNRYFYGKLLSVEDFETEQKYMNNKRRMINRFLHGTGVVCGMNVVAVDDRTISVEKGFALDYCGREILIDNPVTKKLDMLDGFDSYNDQDQNNTHLYLCVEYEEKEKEPVHSITNAKRTGADSVEYNKYAEGYHLYLTNEEPQNPELGNNGFYEEAQVVYWGNRIRIRQSMPKFLESNSPFELKILVENMGQTRPFSFSYQLALTAVQGNPDTGIRIEFEEDNDARASQYEFTFPLTTMAVKEAMGSVGIEEGSFSLTVGGKKQRAEAKGTITANIIGNKVIREVIGNYYSSAMEEITKNSFPQGIYLAKLSVLKAGSTYIIDHSEPMPFEQYVYSSPLAEVVHRYILREQEKGGQKKRGDPEENKKKEQPDREGYSQYVAGGTAILDLGIGGSAGQKFFSSEIIHGLGLGQVHITLGEAYGLEDESPVVYGAMDIFEDKEDGIKASLAAKADPTKGTFIIGLKCLETTTQRQVKIHWMAVKDSTKTVLGQEQRTMMIKPDLRNLTVCETYYFEALILGVTQSRIRWSVKEAGGGTIDDNGMYTAPNKPGVYEIVAESMEEPQLKASAFIIVRE